MAHFLKKNLRAAKRWKLFASYHIVKDDLGLVCKIEKVAS